MPDRIRRVSGGGPYEDVTGYSRAVVVDGRVVKHAGRLVDADLPAVRGEVESTVEYLRSTLGEEAWQAGMFPDLPTAEVLDNPYQYTDYKSDSTHAGGEERVLGR